MKTIYIQKVKSKWPVKPTRADEEDEFRRALNHFGLKESDIYENIEGKQVKQEA